MGHTLSHLGVIMDGNRRWAKKQSLNFGDGYAKGGFDAVKRTVDFCFERSIKHLSLYTFSLENFKRPQIEQDFLFDTIVARGSDTIDFFKERQICVTFEGDRLQFPTRVLPICEKLEEETKEFSSLFLHILFCYGGRQELLFGVKKIAQDIKNGLFPPEAITEKMLNDSLWTGAAPDPELIIRTSGARRLSNFLLFKAAYSEFYFLDCLWPEITVQDLDQAIASYYGISRNFGV